LPFKRNLQHYIAAAAMGQIFSDTSGVLFGSTIEDMVLRLGLTVRCCTLRILPTYLLLV
jgi:hypothetical protein